MRRASAAESWACLVFGRLGRQQIAIDFARELAELAEKEAIELRKLTAALAYFAGHGAGVSLSGLHTGSEMRPLPEARASLLPEASRANCAYRVTPKHYLLEP